MFKHFLTVSLLSSYLLLASCGTTGPLYIPEQRYPQKTQPETPTDKESASDSQSNN